MIDEAGPPATIQRFDIHWRMPEGDARPLEARRRSLEDALLAGPLDDALQNALAQAGVGLGEEVCVRAITLPEVLVNPALPDAAALSMWCRTIEAAVVRAVRTVDDGGNAPGVVRYRSRSHAVVDLVVSCLLAETGRAWAWRQLGVWPDALAGIELGSSGLPTAVSDHVTRTLLESSELIVPVLLRLAALGRLGSVMTQLGTTGLAALAGEAWRAAGGHALQRNAPPARGAFGTEALLAQAAALVARSRLAPELRRAAHLAPAVRELWAHLVIVESDPALVSCRTDATELVPAVARSLQPDEGPGGSGAIVEEPISDSPRAVAPTAAAARLTAADSPAVPAPADRVAANEVIAETVPEETVPEETVPPETRAPREGSRTLWGGLLFLLHLVGKLGVPERLATGGAPVDVRAALYGLGTELLGAAAQQPPDPADPALLAFCGLSPATPRGLLPGPPTPEALARLRSEAAAVTAELARCLAPGPADSDPADADLAGPDLPGLLARVCRRPAMIVCDPGWTDVMLDLREVDTDLRRAGLDLDLGFIPWLGAVVRFCYV